MKPSYLKLSDEEFDQYMTGSHPSQQETPTGESGTQMTQPQSEEEDTDATDDEQDLPTPTIRPGKENGKVQQEIADLPFSVEELNLQKYEFLDRELEDLTIRDISQLLKDYKKLARQNETLKKILVHKPFSSLPAAQVTSRLDIARSSDAVGLSMDDYDAQELISTPNKRQRTTSNIAK